MSWSPSTRIGSNDEVCAFDDCREHNIDTSLYTLEGFDTTRYLCQKHYQEIGRLFVFVSKCDRCERNKAAELDRCLLTFWTIKYDGRVYELCESHRLAYDAMIVALY